MILWRISNHLSLEGGGGLVVEGRWHNAGKPVVYCAETPTLAVLEVLVHLQVEQPPRFYRWLRIETPPGLAHREWPASQDARDTQATRRWGDGWLEGGETALARVPTVIAPESFNWLINPRHPDAHAIKVVQSGRWPWDARLFRA